MGVVAALVAVPSLLSVPAAGQPAPADLDPSAVGSLVQRHLDRTGLPGVTVAVVKDDRVVHVAGHGHDSTGRPLSGHSPMRLASVSKSMTAAAVMQLVEAGRFDLDNPVTGLLPAFQPRDERVTSITVRQLLNQTSGLSDGTVDLAGIDRASSLREAVATLADASLASAPGQQYRYSNPNYYLAARVVEVVSGESFPDYLRRHVFEPLGMTESTADPSFAVPDGYTEAYGMWPSRPEPGGFHLGAGGVVSTGSDMAKWMIAQNGNAPAVLSRHSLAVMHTPVDGARYALGWGVEKPRDGPRRISHGGNLMTASAVQALIPDTGYGIVVLSNSGSLYDETTPIYEGLVAMTQGSSPDEPSATLLPIDLVLAGLTLAAAALGVVGVVRSRKWAYRHRGRCGWQIGLRMLPILLPAALLAGYPSLVGYLTGGRTVTWAQLTYVSLPVLILLAVAAAAGLAVGAARVVRLLRSPVPSAG